MSGHSIIINASHQEAVALLREGKIDEAEKIYINILKKAPAFISAYNNLGIIYRMKGNLEKAIEYYQKTIKINPKYFQGYTNLANIYRIQSNFIEAEKFYKKALEINPNFVDAYNNWGATLQLLGRLEEAVECYEKAIKIDPSYMDAYGNLGGVLLLLGRTKEAEICLRAVKNTPNSPESLYNLANLLKEKGEIVEAANLYKKVIEQRLDNSDAYNGLLDCLRQLCKFEEVGKIEAKLTSLTIEELKRGGRTGETPFTAISRSDDPLWNLQVAKAWSAQIQKSVSDPNPGFYFDRLRKTHKKIRVGYISRDFTDHPVGHIIKGMFSKHDKRKFEVYCFSFGGRGEDRFRKEVEKSVNYFVDISSMSYLDAAERIHAEEIDILIDLMGHTLGNRLEIMAFRPSPVQISYLGFPGSMGADFIDFGIVDRTLVPESLEKYYSERLIYMPDCYQVNDSDQKISKRNFKRSDFGLPEKAFVFGNLNREFKITPEIFGVWMKILKAVPNSVLWLLSKNSPAQENLQKEAQKRGINPKRLIFAKMIPLEEHLKRLPLADLMLDTYPYSGGATTSHALRMGVPVITCLGKTYLSRMTASLLHAVGMDELTVKSLKEYENLALDLANNSKKFRVVKVKLAKNLKTSKLFDTKTFVKNLEKIYQEIYNDYLSGRDDLLSSKGDLPEKIQSKKNQARIKPLRAEFKYNSSNSVEWKKDSIVFICGPQNTPWNPKSMQKPKGAFIGGSEEALVYMSEELVKLGYEVTVCGEPRKKGKYNGVIWKDYRDLNIADKFNIVVYFRSPEFIDLNCRTKKTYLWCHDVLLRDKLTPERLDKLDKVIVLSDAHRQNLPEVSDKKFLISSNGYFEYFPKIKPKNHQNWCIWTSSYNRGLEYLLEIWPDVIKEVPEAKLHIFYGWQIFDIFFGKYDSMMLWRKKIEKMMKQPGIENHGRVPQPEMERWYKKCGVFSYPCDFYEVSCISAIKAQLWGAVPVTTTIGALKETVKYGIKIDGDIREEAVREKYKRNLIKALKDTKWQRQQRKLMMSWARKKYSWISVAKQLSKEFRD